MTPVSRPNDVIVRRSARLAKKVDVTFNDTNNIVEENESSESEEAKDGNKRKRFSRQDKGKGKLVHEEDSDLLKTFTLKPLVINQGLDRNIITRDEKGKGKVGDEDSFSDSDNDNDNENEPNVDVDTNVTNQTVTVMGNLHANMDWMEEYREHRRTYQKEQFKSIARELASSFARFSSKDELELGLGSRVMDFYEVGIEPQEPEDLPGRFSTAMGIIKDQELDKNREGLYVSVRNGMKWIPLKKEEGRRSKRVSPSLQDICLPVLSENADSISSLDFVPDNLRHKICWALCDRRKMNSYFLELLLLGSPTEIRIRDCSWLSEEAFVKAFEGCNTSKLTVLQFDLAGLCLPDYILPSTLTRSPNSLPALITLSLKGAYRLTDEGLRRLVSSAPNLKSVDLRECSMLTSEGICCLVDSLKLGLRELYLDGIHGIDAKLILSVLLKLESLEVLSLAGIHNVSDDFVSKLVFVHGCRMKEIVLADCKELSNSSLEAIGNNCPGLHALDLTKLRKLTDAGLRHLANGCREIQKLKFCRNEFSDEAVAAYLDIHGETLRELSLNNVTKVSNNTAVSLARNCRDLRILDLSWCRNLSDESLGLVVDNCSSLELVKLFGCTQVTSVFLDGYSNPRVKLVGLNLTSLIQHIDVPDFLQGPLRYSSIA